MTPATGLAEYDQERDPYRLGKLERPVGSAATSGIPRGRCAPPREVRSVRSSDLSECGSCSRLSFCGRCHAQALVEDGDLYGPSSYAQRRADTLEALDDQTAGS